MVTQCKNEDCKKELKVVHGITLGQSGYCENCWGKQLIENKKGFNKRWKMGLEL